MWKRASWLVASRLLGGGYIIDFVGGTRLLVRRGMSGATGNLYFGLQDFQEMAFVIHFLRKGDLIADIGANIGSYSVLASGVSGARSFSYEPVASTVRHLEDNISLNRLGDLVTIRATALGSALALAAVKQKVSFSSAHLPVTAAVYSRLSLPQSQKLPPCQLQNPE